MRNTKKAWVRSLGLGLLHPHLSLRRVFEVASQQGKNSAGPWVFLLNPPLHMVYFPPILSNLLCKRASLGHLELWTLRSQGCKVPWCFSRSTARNGASSARGGVCSGEWVEQWVMQVMMRSLLATSCNLVPQGSLEHEYTAELILLGSQGSNLLYLCVSQSVISWAGQSAGIWGGTRG